MIIELYTNNSERIAVNKELTSVKTLTGTLRGECSITAPIIQCSGGLEEYTSVNYAYISDFKRYYYVSEIKSIRNNIVELTMTCDVLMSFKTEFLTQSAIIKRQADNWNLYIDDGSFKAQQNSRVQVKAFPNAIEGESFVLVLAGTT